MSASDDKMNYEGVVTTSVAKQISENIRAAIMDGHLKADDRLPTETDLAERYGVSRPTIREALKRLAAQNLIRSRRGPTGGNFVVRPDPKDVAETLSGSAMLLVGMGAFSHEDISQARQEFQGTCCRLAALHRTEQHLLRMEAEIAVQGDPSITDEQFCRSDVRFHRAIVDATGNALIGFVMHGVVEAMMPVTNLVIFRVRNREAITEFHRQLVVAIRAHHAEQAQAVLHDLMEYTRAQYAEALTLRDCGNVKATHS